MQIGRKLMIIYFKTKTLNMEQILEFIGYMLIFAAVDIGRDKNSKLVFLSKNWLSMIFIMIFIMILAISLIENY